MAEGLILLEPFTLGKGIDGMISGDYAWMIILLCLFMASNAFMYKRMVFDTKVYTRIYNSIVFNFFKKDDIPNSAKIARTDMANQIVDFLEHYAHYYISTVIILIGSSCFIMYQNHIVGVITLCCVIPIIAIVYRFYKKIKQATVVGNNHYEQKVDIINREDDAEIKTFFERRRRILIYGSTIQGKHWVSVHFMKSLFLIIALVVYYETSPDITSGEIISMYEYINRFLIALMSIPVAIESWNRLSDVTKRIV